MNVLPGISRAAIVAAMSFLLLPTAHGQEIKVDKNNRTIAVTATDRATAMADTASINIGYQEFGPDAGAAYAHASQVSNAISEALTEAGIKADAIESSAQSIGETQPYEVDKLTPAEQARRKFRVQQTWIVKTDAKDAARILNVAINAGANNSGQINWSLADENALEAEAAGKALVRARSIAEQMAKGLNVKLGDLIYASNVAGRNGMDDMPIPAGMMKTRSAETVTKPLSISAQKVSKTATVSAIFAIE